MDHENRVNEAIQKFREEQRRQRKHHGYAVYSDPPQDIAAAIDAFWSEVERQERLLPPDGPYCVDRKDGFIDGKIDAEAIVLAVLNSQ
jgi:hypothetical protein